MMMSKSSFTQFFNHPLIPFNLGRVYVVDFFMRKEKNRIEIHSNRLIERESFVLLLGIKPYGLITYTQDSISPAVQVSSSI